jgi:hypothetical protein
VGHRSGVEIFLYQSVYNLFMPDDRLQNTINELIEMAHEAVQDLDWESVKKFSEGV